MKNSALTLLNASVLHIKDVPANTSIHDILRLSLIRLHSKRNQSSNIWDHRVTKIAPKKKNSTKVHNRPDVSQSGKRKTHIDCIPQVLMSVLLHVRTCTFVNIPWSVCVRATVPTLWHFVINLRRDGGSESHKGHALRRIQDRVHFSYSAWVHIIT